MTTSSSLATTEPLATPPLESASPAVTEPLAPPAPLSRPALPHALRRRLASARELARRNAEAPVDDPLPTAVSVLDGLLSGGLPRGCLVELVGWRSSGRFSTVLSTLAAATGSGEAAALIDLGNSLDPRTAAATGVELERLLWVRPPHLRQALACAETLLHGGFPLVALDMGTPPVPGGRGSQVSWLRLARAAESHRAVLLVASPYRVSGTAAAAVIDSERPRPTWRGDRSRAVPRLLDGLTARLVLSKRRGRRTGDSGLLRLSLPVQA